MGIEPRRSKLLNRKNLTFSPMMNNDTSNDTSAL
jgi:hypothetical protein